MRNLRHDLEVEFGLDIDYWVLVDFRGAERLIDAIGGIDVDIPSDLAIERWWYSDDDVSHRLISLPAGRVHLGGYEAVAFARLRAWDDDLHRIKRQQIVIKGATSRAFSAGFAADPLSLWDAYSSAIKTDVPRSRMPGLALLVSGTGGDISTFSLADPIDGMPAVRDTVLPSGASVLEPVSEHRDYWLHTVFGSQVELESDMANSSP